MEKIIAFSCTHMPLADNSAKAFLIAQIEEKKPTQIVHLGDLLEADAASRWPSEYTWTLGDEFIAADRFLLDIRKAAPVGCKFVFLEGNHDCLTPDHQVLTSVGWVEIENVTTQHLVATQNSDGDLEWRYPDEVIYKPAPSTLYKLEGKGFNQLVTGNHRIPVTSYGSSAIRYVTPIDLLSSMGVLLVIPGIESKHILQRQHVSIVTNHSYKSVHCLSIENTNFFVRRQGKVSLTGNCNILALNRIDKKLRHLCDYRVLIKEFKDGHWHRPCKYICDKERGVYRVGQVGFTHGYRAGVSADEFQAILFGDQNTLTIGGHTHQPKPVTQAMKTKGMPLWVFYANPGCLRNLKPEYVKRLSTHGWGQGIVYVECDTVTRLRKSINWSAETIIHKMASNLYPMMGSR